MNNPTMAPLKHIGLLSYFDDTCHLPRSFGSAAPFIPPSQKESGRHKNRRFNFGDFNTSGLRVSTPWQTHRNLLANPINGERNDTSIDFTPNGSLKDKKILPHLINKQRLFPKTQGHGYN